MEGSRVIFMTGFIYIMTNKRRTVLYTGSTDSLVRRVKQRRTGKAGSFTDRYNINTVVYIKEFDTLREARVFEKKIKGWTRTKKIKLINASNPEWKELLP